MVIATTGATPVNLRLAVPVFFAVLVGIPVAWDVLRSSCDADSTLYYVDRGYITGLWGNSYSASLGDGSEIITFQRPSHWHLHAVATAKGVAEDMPASAILERSNLLDPLHAKWGVSVASLEIGSVRRELGLYEPYTTTMGAGEHVLHSSKGWLWGRTFTIEAVDGGRRRKIPVASAERFLYSRLKWAPVKYRMCIKKWTPVEATFGILATMAITDIQNSDDDHKR